MNRWGKNSQLTRAWSLVSKATVDTIVLVCQKEHLTDRKWLYNLSFLEKFQGDQKGHL